MKTDEVEIEIELDAECLELLEELRMLLADEMPGATDLDILKDALVRRMGVEPGEKVTLN